MKIVHRGKRNSVPVTGSDVPVMWGRAIRNWLEGSIRIGSKAFV